MIEMGKLMSAVFVALAAAGAFAYEAKVDVVYESGRAETRTMPLVEKAKGTYEWRMTKADLRPEAYGPVRAVTVTPEFAQAHYGEEGWFVAADGSRGFYKARDVNTNKLWEASYQIVPLYGMKTPRTTFLAHATGMKYHAGVNYVASNGLYTVSLTFHEEMYDIYEDLAAEFVVFDDPKADYNEMAHAYRDYQREHAALVPLKDRIASRPALAYALKYPEVRIRQAWKPVPAVVDRQVPENEPPVTPYVKFARVTELAKGVKDAGVEGAEFCLVGWNKGGHDGAYPQLFPVEPTLGGEEALRTCVKDVQALGYRIVAHGNYNDAYMLADSFDLEFVKEKDENGFVVRPTQTWGGGGKFTMCPQRAYEKFAVRDAARVAALGFSGLYYLDVVTCHVPRACRDPRHPLTRAGIAKWFNAILDLHSETFGGVSSEGACDAYVGHFDSVLTVTWSSPFPKPDSELTPEQREERHHSFFSDVVPFWELVYHGYLLYTPFRNIMNATANPDPRFQLKLAEYDGRPTFYVHSRFKTYVSAAMGARDLRADTDEELAFSVDCIRKGADEYARRSRLQLEFMERHERIAEGVYRTSFSNGESILSNYNSAPVTVDGREIPALGYVIMESTRRKR